MPNPNESLEDIEGRMDREAHQADMDLDHMKAMEESPLEKAQKDLKKYRAVLRDAIAYIHKERDLHHRPVIYEYDIIEIAKQHGIDLPEMEVGE